MSGISLIKEKWDPRGSWQEDIIDRIEEKNIEKNIEKKARLEKARREAEKARREAEKARREEIRIANSRENIRDIIPEIEKARLEKARLEKEIVEREKARLGNEIVKKEKEIAEIEKKIAERRIARLEKEIAERKDRIDRLEIEKKLVEREKSKLGNEIVKKEMEKRRIARLEEEIAEIEKKIDRLKIEKEMEKRKIARLEKEIVEKGKEIVEREKEKKLDGMELAIIELVGMELDEMELFGMEQAEMELFGKEIAIMEDTEIKKEIAIREKEIVEREDAIRKKEIVEREDAIRKKEIADIVVDFTEQREEISQEFDNLCKEIIELDWYDSISMQKIGGNGSCSRKFIVLEVEYSLYITKNKIEVIGVYQKNKELHTKFSYGVLGDFGKQKYGYFLVEDDELVENEAGERFNFQDFDYKNYNRILDILLSRVYTYTFIEIVVNKLRNITSDEKMMEFEHDFINNSYSLIGINLDNYI